MVDGNGDGEVVGQNFDILGSEIVAYQARAERRYGVRIYLTNPKNPLSE